MYMDFIDMTVKTPWIEFMSQQFDVIHLGFDQTTSTINTPLDRYRNN